MLTVVPLIRTQVEVDGEDVKEVVAAVDEVAAIIFGFLMRFPHNMLLQQHQPRLLCQHRLHLDMFSLHPRMHIFSVVSFIIASSPKFIADPTAGFLTLVVQSTVPTSEQCSRPFGPALRQCLRRMVLRCLFLELVMLGHLTTYCFSLTCGLIYFPTSRPCVREKV
jgi:hypothetical protein